MRAIVYDTYGPPEVLRLEEVEKPSPKDDEVLIRIHATTVTRADVHAREGSPLIGRLFTGVRKPKRRMLGHEFAGEVEAIGSEVTDFAVGDRVFGAIPYLGILTGSHAEYFCVKASAPIAHIPDGMPFEEAAAICDGGFLALGGWRKANLHAGQKVLVYGASGSIGTAAVQLARHFAAHITAVCNTKNVELVRSLGAEEVVDYLREDFTKNGETYEIIFDAVGKHSFRRCRDSLAPGGLYVPTDGFINAFWLLWGKRFGDKKVVADIPPRFKKADTLFLKELIEAGEYRAVVDRTYPLEDVVEATRYVETGQKTGNVVLTV
ncbi:MAG TPA: NAD(P)-dependent alcohol dehydrogenase [Gaiellaceae bacterium]|nr:NAD(P)-dependent alcohol dehydrogenase [Gaiellaceae bacterium]